jgi:hypothetical protein
MAGAKVPLSFRIFKGDQLVREERLSLSVIKLGKVPSAHLKIDDETVSRMHAIIEVNGPDDVSIIDLGSTKGTFVNGQRVNKAKLMSGDSIVVGETRIEIAIGVGEDTISEPAYAEPPQMTPGYAPPAYAPPAAYSPPAIPAQSFAPPAFGASSLASNQGFEAPRMPARDSGSPFGANPGFAAPAAPSPRPPAAYGAPAPVMFQQSADIDDMGGSRAVEVAAMLGDSVVKVKHCMNPKGGKVTSATWAGFGVSAFCLVISAVAFITAVRGASFNFHKKETWTVEQKKPSYAFRPEMLGLGYDWLLFGGVIAGLGGVVFSLARMRRETDSTPQFSIGSAPKVDFPLDSAPAAAFNLVEPRGDEFVVNFAQGMEGDMTVDGQSISLAELASQGRARPSSATAGAMEMSIPPTARVRIRSGQTTFLVSSVAQPKRYATPLFAGLEGLVLLIVGGSAIAHLGFLALINAAETDGTTGGTDGDDNEENSTRSASTAQDVPPPPPPEDKPDDGEEESGGTGTAMVMEEGKMGKKDSTRAEGQYKMAKTADQEQLARTQAVEQARTAGILGSSALMQGGAFASLTGTGDISSGFDDADVMGGLLGNEAGEMNGGFGFGRSGFGPGGGGTGWGTIGTGRYGTIGHGSGTGSGYGVGGGRGGGRGHTAAVPSVSIGQPDSQGDLDKAIIRRYIKRNEAKIQNCYERVLLAKPGLSGTVSTQFFISPDGTVASSSGNGVDGEVSSCVAQVIKNIEFPKPKGGGGVQVKYPFQFRLAGG